MSAPCAVRRSVPAALALLLGTASLAFANTLPPGPVLGHPADYVIVTPAAFATEFQILAKWKTRTGLPAYVKTMESIVAEYPSARDDAERMRMFLQDAHTQWGTHWVLLGGTASFVPVRMARTTFYGGLDFATDLYFSCLHGTWDADGDGIFGEGYQTASDPGDVVDLNPDVFVGRAPVRSAAEARSFVAKTLRAGFEPFTPTPHVALFAANVLFPQDWTPGSSISLDGAAVTEEAIGGVTAIPGVTQRLYQNTTDYPGSSPLTGASLLSALAAGTDLFVLMSFGGPDVVTAGGDSLHSGDLAPLAAAPRPTSAYLLGSSCGGFTGNELPLVFVRGATGGASTCIVPSTYSFPTSERVFLDEYLRLVYPPNSKAVGEANALSKVPFIPFSAYDGVTRLTMMELTLLGDPAAHVRTGPRAPLAMEAPAAVTSGEPGFDVLVSSNGVPVAGARVTAMLGETDLAISTSDSDGRAHLAFAAGGSGVGDLTVNAADGGMLEREVAVQSIVLDVGGGGTRFRFDTPQPNPALASARFSGAVTDPAELEIFDVGGRRVRGFALEPGTFDVRWDLRDASGRRVAPGLYLARLGSAGGARVQRLLVGR